MAESNSSEPTADVRRRTEAWYENYARSKDDGRNDLLQNPGVLFQSLAFDIALVEALRRLPLDRKTARVLDVGCGSGASLLNFLRLGFSPENLVGVDILPARIDQAKARLPSLSLLCEDASRLSFPSESFDLVFESTMFVQITDDEVARRISQEMVRTLRPGGHLVLSDWRYSKPWNRHYAGLSKDRVRRLFAVGDATEWVTSVDGALLPPVGRFLSAYLPSAYFLVQRTLRPLVGQRTVVLKKR